MESPNLNDRLERLERECSLLKKIAISFAVILGCLLVVGFQKQDTFDSVRVKELKVIGEDGKTQIDLRATGGGSGGKLLINDSFGDPKALLEVSHRGALLIMGEATVEGGDANVVAITSSSFGSSVNAEDSSGASIELLARHGKCSIVRSLAPKNARGANKR